MTSVIADPVDASHAYVSYGGFREGYHSANVFETTLSGHALKLKNVSGNLPNAPVNFLAYDRAADTVYAATDLGVFFMQDDNKVWTRLGDNLPNTATEDLKMAAPASCTSAPSAAAPTASRSSRARPATTRRCSTDLSALSSQVTGMGLSAA